MQAVLSILFLVVSVIYAIQSERWRAIWKNSLNFKTNSFTDYPKLSVIIAFCNEEDNLPNLLKSLQIQTYNNWELILVDDNSEDNGLIHCKELLVDFPVKVDILLNKFKAGKKNALQYGAQYSNGELIVTTDADCIVNDNWLKTIATFYQQNDSDLIIAPVFQLSDANHLSLFQQYEFIALQLSGAATALDRNPIMLNGANLACKRSVYLNADLKTKIASGDDMFLLEWVKKNNKTIDYIKSPFAIVNTRTEPTINKMLSQKSRWALKSKHYSDVTVLLTGAIVALMNILLVSFIFLSFFDSTFTVYYSFLILLKIIIDFRLIKSGDEFFQFNPKFHLFIYYQLLYPLYVLLVFLYPFFIPLHWKGRKI
nr:glycosyltransferase [uncultured Carboxylicivirga sp.]